MCIWCRLYSKQLILQTVWLLFNRGMRKPVRIPVWSMKFWAWTRRLDSVFVSCTQCWVMFLLWGSLCIMYQHYDVGFPFLCFSWWTALSSFQTLKLWTTSTPYRSWSNFDDPIRLMCLKGILWDLRKKSGKKKKKQLGRDWSE